jgi:molybdate transport system regulatory protein
MPRAPVECLVNLKAGISVWLERRGQPLLNKEGLQLLERIDHCRSISAAARDTPMSYLYAWRLVKSMNNAAGEPLVTASAGGKHGGGARLTASGRAALILFRKWQTQVDAFAASCLAQLVTAPPVIHDSCRRERNGLSVPSGSGIPCSEDCEGFS